MAISQSTSSQGADKSPNQTSLPRRINATLPAGTISSARTVKAAGIVATTAPPECCIARTAHGDIALCHSR